MNTEVVTGTPLEIMVSVARVQGIILSGTNPDIFYICVHKCPDI